MNLRDRPGDPNYNYMWELLTWVTLIAMAFFFV